LCMFHLCNCHIHCSVLSETTFPLVVPRRLYDVRGYGSLREFKVASPATYLSQDSWNKTAMVMSSVLSFLEYANCLDSYLKGAAKKSCHSLCGNLQELGAPSHFDPRGLGAKQLD
jgi:hypothetical protein